MPNGFTGDSPSGGERGLIRIAPSWTRDAARGPRPSAAFLAHLIATAERVPQARSRRRAGFGEAAAAYAATARFVRPPTAGQSK